MSRIQYKRGKKARHIKLRQTFAALQKKSAGNCRRADKSHYAYHQVLAVARHFDEPVVVRVVRHAVPLRPLRVVVKAGDKLAQPVRQARRLMLRLHKRNVDGQKVYTAVKLASAAKRRKQVVVVYARKAVPEVLGKKEVAVRDAP